MARARRVCARGRARMRAGSRATGDYSARDAFAEARRHFIERERDTKARYAEMRKIPMPELWARNLEKNGEPGEADAFRAVGGCDDSVA